MHLRTARYSCRELRFQLEALDRRVMLSGTMQIDGVQPAALDQPQIHALFRRDLNSDPLMADDGFGNTSFDVQAYLDTGTSGLLLSQETAQGLGISSEVDKNGNPVTFSDIGVGGNED